MNSSVVDAPHGSDSMANTAGFNVHTAVTLTATSDTDGLGHTATTA